MPAKSSLPLRKVTIRVDSRDWDLINSAHKEGKKANEVARTLLHAYADQLRARGYANCKEDHLP